MPLKKVELTVRDPFLEKNVPLSCCSKEDEDRKQRKEGGGGGTGKLFMEEDNRRRETGEGGLSEREKGGLRALFILARLDSWWWFRLSVQVEAKHIEFLKEMIAKYKVTYVPLSPSSCSSAVFLS